MSASDAIPASINSCSAKCAIASVFGPPNQPVSTGKSAGILRPPDRYTRIRKQECQIGKILSVFEPPTGLEAQQDLDDVAEADIRSNCGFFAFRRRKHDLSQERNRHREDCGIALISVAIGTVDHAASIARFDGGHG